MASVEGSGGSRQRLPAPASAPQPEAWSVGTLFYVLKHRHFTDRMFEGTDNVREIVEEVWDGFIRRQEEITRVAKGESTVPRIPGPYP